MSSHVAGIEAAVATERVARKARESFILASVVVVSCFIQLNSLSDGDEHSIDSVVIETVYIASSSSQLGNTQQGLSCYQNLRIEVHCFNPDRRSISIFGQTR